MIKNMWTLTSFISAFFVPRSLCFPEIVIQPEIVVVEPMLNAVQWKDKTWK